MTDEETTAASSFNPYPPVSFTGGLKTLATSNHMRSDDRNFNRAFFGSLEVGLHKQGDQLVPYMNLADWQLRLSNEELKKADHITVDFEKFLNSRTRSCMRIQFIYDPAENAWSITQSGPKDVSLIKNPEYEDETQLAGNKECSLSLGEWRVINNARVNDPDTMVHQPNHRGGIDPTIGFLGQPVQERR